MHTDDAGNPISPGQRIAIAHCVEGLSWATDSQSFLATILEVTPTGRVRAELNSECHVWLVATDGPAPAGGIAGPMYIEYRAEYAADLADPDWSDSMPTLDGDPGMWANGSERSFALWYAIN